MSPLKNEEWITLRSKDVTLSEVEVKYVLSTMYPILDKTPDKSHFILEISKRAEEFTAKLNINSQAEFFESEVTAENIYRLSTALKKDILKKIEFWQQSRFLSSVV